MKLILIAMAALLLAAITMVASVSAQTGGRLIFVDDDSDCSTATEIVVPYPGFNITVFHDHSVGGEVWDFDFCAPDGHAVIPSLSLISPRWHEGERVELPFEIDAIDGIMSLTHDQNERGGIDEWEVMVMIQNYGHAPPLANAIDVIVRFVERPTPTPTPTLTPITTPAPTPILAEPTRTPTPVATASPTPTATPVSIDDRVSALENEVSTLRALIGALIEVLLGWRQSE